MADNRYNVDDILRELNQKPAAPEQRAPAGYEPERQRPQPSAPRRPAPTDDSWEPVESRRSAPQRPNSGVAPQQQRQMRPQPGPQRSNSGATPPRLGQQAQRPKTREEMDRLIGNFSDESDPFGDLGFLDRAPAQPTYEEQDNPARHFTPDWDRPAPAPQRPQPAPQRPNSGVTPPPQQRPQPAPQRPNSGVTPPPQRPNSGVTPPPQRSGTAPRSLMQSRDRRSMADAARMITSGGLEDFPEPTSQQPTQRGRQPMRQPAPQQRSQLAPQRPNSGVAPPPQRPNSGVAPPPQRPNSGVAPPPQRPNSGVAPQQAYPVYPDEMMDPVQDRLGRLDALDRQPQRPQPAPQRRGSAATAPPTANEPTRQRAAVRPEPPEAEQFAAEQEETAVPRKSAQGGASMQQISEQLNGMRAGLLVRVLVNVLTLGLVIYLALANSYTLPLPGFLSGSEQVSTLLWCSVVLVAISALASANAVGSGILALCKLRPSNDSYTALAVFACLVQGAYMAMQPELMTTNGDSLYLPMAVLMLTFNTLGKLIMMARMTGSFAILAAKGPKQMAGIMDNREFAKRISAEIIGDEPCLVYAAQAASVSGFLDQAFSESKAEDISKIIAPLSALAAVVMALVSYLFNRDIFTSACVFTAALCITAPLAGVIASALPLYITNGKLARWGASLCGYDAVGQFAAANGVVLRAAQLLPKGSVSLQDIQVLDRRPIDQVLVDAASVLCGCDSYLAPVFNEMVQDSSMLYQPENIEFVDGMGVSAWVNGRRVLIGNRNLMASYGVPVPDMDYERQYTAGGGEVLYIANSGEASGMLLLGYKPDKSMRRSLELICDSDMGVCVYSNDPTLTTAKLSTLYRFPQELLTIIPATMQQGTERYLRPVQTAEACVVHNGSPAAYLRTILAARSCSRCITLQTALLLMSVVIGFATVTFFAFTQNMEALTWVTLTVFQFFWLLLELVVPLFKH